MEIALDEPRNRWAASEVGDPSNPRKRREALDDGGDEGGVEVELEMVSGEHDRGVQRLERASRDSEVVVRGEMCWEERGKLNKISIKILAFLSVCSHI